MNFSLNFNGNELIACIIHCDVLTLCIYLVDKNIIKCNRKITEVLKIIEKVNRTKQRGAACKPCVKYTSFLDLCGKNTRRNCLPTKSPACKKLNSKMTQKSIEDALGKLSFSRLAISLSTMKSEINAVNFPFKR
jgi:hypothetical protein